ncbi:MAG: hypothetical protein A2V83_07690 [Nitrospirae bacterium RBG_16_64_22]|nr:MAG: hypothetical protein A2V83_07690 [Nitrospirae bacterium RBG_16_64_22]
MDAVFDSSTLILLAKIDTLRMVTEDVHAFIPARVRTECLAKETFDAAMIASMIAEKKITVERAGPDAAVRKLARDFRIERGEAEALWLARKQHFVLAVDDGPTIKACRILGQPFVTAVHFLIQMRNAGRLNAEAAMVKFEMLGRFGRYGERIVEDAARRIREGTR